MGGGWQPSIIPKIFDLFREKEELEDVDGLHQMYEIVRGLSKWDTHLCFFLLFYFGFFMLASFFFESFIFGFYF